MVQTARQETSADGALPSVARRKTFGIVPNAARPFLISAVGARIGSWVTAEEDAIIVVFVHGWKHDARTDDANLLAFQGVPERP